MKIGIFSLAVAAFLMGGVLTADAQQKAPSAVATPGASDWQSPDNLRQKLAAEISKRLTGVESSQIQAFIKNKENLQLLFMYHFA